jgi:carbonic anhydrase/acetyltransferase-like protein (isoleucine patch superfamily)
MGAPAGLAVRMANVVIDRAGAMSRIEPIFRRGIRSFRRSRATSRLNCPLGSSRRETGLPLYEIDDVAPTLPEDGSAWVAPSADVIGDARIGRDCSIWFGAVIRADNTPIIVGDRSNVQDGAMLHSDPGSPLTMGEGCTIGHHAVLHGCTLGDNVLIGMGATVLNDAVIGDDCLVGAGALVTEGKSFPPGSLIVGVPARVARDIDEQAVAMLRLSATGYATRGRHYMTGLRMVG